jgi:hypothetical protein
MLFTEILRTDVTRKTNRESDFAFLDRSARPEMERVRHFLEYLARDYPRSELIELVARVRSGNDTQFKSAVFELSLYSFLIRLGYKLEPHPELKNGSRSRPDFYVVAPNGEDFYLEAVLASQDDGTDAAAEARKDTTLDALSQAVHPNFMVEVESNGAPTSQPSGNRLRSATLAWLNSLNPDEIQRTIVEQGIKSAPSLKWAHEDWELLLRPIPLKLERRGKSNTLIGILDGGAGFIDGWSPIRDAVKFKGGKYGDLHKPLLVAINVGSFDLDPIDEMQALYGQEQFLFSRDDLEKEPIFERAPNGAWYGHKGPKGRRVSGVWLFNDLNAYTIASRRHTVYFNPWARHALPEGLKQMPHASATDGLMQWQDGVSFRDVLGLSHNWPS